MKNKIYFLLSLPFCLFMAACEHEIGRDGEDSVGDLSSIRISVSDAGFAPAAQEDGEAVYSRDFKVGDKIGVFAVMNGVMVEGQSNMCFTASDNGNGGIVWTTEDLDEGAFFSEAVYFAYYPYMEGLSATLDPEAADAGQFFSEMISSFMPEKEQSDISAFDASDLMIGSGLISNGNTVAFVMEHAMSMVVIELPTEYYSFDNTDYEIPDYVIGGFKDAVFDGFTPYSEEGHVFKYIVNSGVSVSVAGSYVDDGGQTCPWNDEVTPEKGKYSKVLVDGGANSIRHTLSPGDFFLADGRLLSKDAPAGEVAAADVIGVVFQINPERMDPAIADSLGGVVHALVIGTKSVKETPGDAGYYHWGITGMDETLIGFTNIFGGYGLESNFRLADRDIYGYSYMQALKTKRSDYYQDGDYPVFAGVDKYSGIVGGPAENAPSNTGWYLPAAGEWFDIIRAFTGLPLVLDDSLQLSSDGAGQFFWVDQGAVVEKMNAAMGKIASDDKDEFFAGGAIWTSSVADTDAARAVSFNDEGYVHCRWTWKDLGLFARAVLAF